MQSASRVSLANSGSSYVCRLRDNSVWKTVTTNYRNDNAGLDTIISDEIVELNGDGDRKLDHKVRVICVRINPHTARGKYAGGASGVDSNGMLRIATNLLDVPADVIALIFAYRWAIEIIFRFFKHTTGWIVRLFVARDNPAVFKLLNELFE